MDTLVIHKPEIHSAEPPIAPAVVAAVVMAQLDTLAEARTVTGWFLRTLQAVAALYERGPAAGRFSALDTAGKLNVIADITAVPYRMMQQYSDRPGELGLLMGKGLADRGKAG